MPDSPDEAPLRKFALKPKEFARVNAEPGTQAPSVEHDVFALRQQVLARERAAGSDELKAQPPAVKRRGRDFRVIVLGGYVGIMLFSGALVSLGGGLRGFLFGLLWGAALGLFYAVGLWWVMYHLMDDY